MKLPKKIKAKWLKALRSGEYVQSRGTLHNPKTGGFCCLGLLQYCTLNGECETGYGGDFAGRPSGEFWNSIGVKNFNMNLETDLVRLNDRSKYSFAKIADWIDKNIESY